MRPVFLFPILSGILAASASGATPQVQMVQRLYPDADELAAQMRLLAADPRDLEALVRAGELALKLGDPTAAGVLFARAEKIDPHNARVKAGAGSLLVRAERPGEALRRFDEAAALGLDPRAFAADRGLAYDLIGEQVRAQRDYRLALKDGADDETVRRYALSLGISGKRDQALEQLDPLLRRNDRGAWRARAFILAMTGDDGGAEKIATTMMPGGLAEGLQPFFERLSSLAPADRAFAVHFGELRATPERVADARLIPALPPLPPEPGIATMIAAQASAPGGDRKEVRRARQKKRGRGEPAPLAAAQPERPPAPSRDDAVPSDAAIAARAPGPAAGPARTATAAIAMHGADPALALNEPPPVPAPADGRARAAGGQNGAGQNGAGQSGAAQGGSGGQGPGTQGGAAAIAAETAPAATSATVPRAPVRSEESILAAIIANIEVPDGAAGPAQPGRDAGAATQGTPPSADADAAAKAAADRRAEQERQALAEKARADKLRADKLAADRLAAERAAAERKAAEAKRLAEAKKAAELKKKNDPKILEPSRIWVQVAGGANEATLAREWERIAAKAPAAFKGRQGWTTKLRATNRVLAGPFKTDEEARAFVNRLAKEDIAAFTFTSEAGQKVTQLSR